MNYAENFAKVETKVDDIVTLLKREGNDYALAYIAAMFKGSSFFMEQTQVEDFIERLDKHILRITESLNNPVKGG